VQRQRKRRSSPRGIGISICTELPAQLRGLRESLQALKQGSNFKTTATTLPDVRTKAQGLVQMVRGFFQKRQEVK
jgi:hypothetical protein